METYLFIALAFIYLLTAFILPKQVQKRIWTVAYILAFAITCVAIFFIKSYAGETLMRVGELNWYYVLYVFRVNQHYSWRYQSVDVQKRDYPPVYGRRR